jgi:hypothetical protein
MLSKGRPVTVQEKEGASCAEPLELVVDKSVTYVNNSINITVSESFSSKDGLRSPTIVRVVEDTQCPRSPPHTQQEQSNQQSPTSPVTINFITEVHETYIINSAGKEQSVMKPAPANAGPEDAPSQSAEVLVESGQPSPALSIDTDTAPSAVSQALVNNIDAVIGQVRPVSQGLSIDTGASPPRPPQSSTNNLDLEYFNRKASHARLLRSDTFLTVDSDADLPGLPVMSLNKYKQQYSINNGIPNRVVFAANGANGSGDDHSASSSALTELLTPSAFWRREVDDSPSSPMQAYKTPVIMHSNSMDEAETPKRSVPGAVNGITRYNTLNQINNNFTANNNNRNNASTMSFFSVGSEYDDGRSGSIEVVLDSIDEPILAAITSKVTTFYTAPPSGKVITRSEDGFGSAPVEDDDAEENVTHPRLANLNSLCESMKFSESMMRLTQGGSDNGGQPLDRTPSEFCKFCVTTGMLPVVGL